MVGTKPPKSKRLTVTERLQIALETQQKLHEKIGRLRHELNNIHYKYTEMRKRMRKVEQALNRAKGNQCP